MKEINFFNEQAHVKIPTCILYVSGSEISQGQGKMHEVEGGAGGPQR